MRRSPLATALYALVAAPLDAICLTLAGLGAGAAAARLRCRAVRLINPAAAPAAESGPPDPGRPGPGWVVRRCLVCVPLDLFAFALGVVTLGLVLRGFTYPVWYASDTFRRAGVAR